MNKELENHLWNRIRECGDTISKSPRDIIEDMVNSGMIQSPKQAWRTLEKWCRKNKYNYGVCLDLGWKE